MTIPLTSSETHLYSPSSLVSNPLEIISVPEVVNSPWGMGGVQLYPLGADGAIVTEVSSRASTLKPATMYTKIKKQYVDYGHLLIKLTININLYYRGIVTSHCITRNTFI